MGLNSRKAQVIMGVLPIITLGLFLFFPFVWRALKTRQPGDIRLAIIFSALEIIGFVSLALSPTTHKDGPDNVVAMLVWIVILAAVITAVWLYRPLNKEERMDQARRDQQPGFSYLS